METLLVWCLLLIEEVTCFFGWHRCHFAAVSYSFNILIFIPFLRIPFRSIPGPFRFQFWNDSIPPELGDSGMLNLAEVPAKFNSCGFRKESVGQGKDLAKDGQRRPTKTKKGPNDDRYVFFMYNHFILFYNESSSHKSFFFSLLRSPGRPTAANDGQRRPTKTKKGPNDRQCHH